MPGDALALVRGIPHIPSVTEINVRSGPSTDYDLIFKVPVGMSGQGILAVQTDSTGRDLDGKIYEWFQLLFDGGAVGWIRDDLLEIEGDCTAFGYPDLSELTFAFQLVRNQATTSAPAAPLEEPEDETPADVPTTIDIASDIIADPMTSEADDAVSNEPETMDVNAGTEISEVNAETQDAVETAPTTSTVTRRTGNVWRTPGPTTEPVMTPILASGDFPDATQDTERVRNLAFRFTASWEGGFSAINTYDKGIVSYGFLQFTLAGGSLISVIHTYLNSSQSDTANGLRALLPRIEAREEALRNDQNFLNLLRTAANEQEMIDAQYAIGTDGYWKQVIEGYTVSRQLKYPLTWALLFDMGVNFGVNNGFVRLAERDLGVPSRSNPAVTGLGEEQLMTYVAQLRKRSHDRQARTENLPGLANRGNFWMKLCTDGDWYLQGNANNMFSSNGRIINALNP